MLRDLVSQQTTLSQLPQGYLKVVTIVQYIEPVTVERMHLFQLRKIIQNVIQLLVNRVLSKLNLQHIEITNTRYVKLLTHYRRCLTHGFVENCINQRLRVQYRRDGLEIVSWHLRKEKAH